MNKKILVAFVGLFVGANLLFGADGARYFSLDKAFETQAFQSRLDASVEYEFGSGSSANIIKSDFTTKQKAKFDDIWTTNANVPKWQKKWFNDIEPTEEMVCQEALLKALLRFEKRAKKMGASKVVNIISYYYQTKFDDKDKFMCWMIDEVATVSLQGDVAH